MSNRKRQTKRRQPDHQDDGLEEVDDLEFAAQFAVVPQVSQQPVVDEASGSAATPQVEDAMKSDDDEIDVDVDDDDESESEEAGNQGEGVDQSNGQDEVDEEDDEEDDLSLQEIVAKMQDAEEDEDEEGEGGPAAKAPPKTRNELDPYVTPIAELEKHLKTTLTVEEKDKLFLGNSSTSSTNLSLAGTLKNHMVADRTVVVESAPDERPLDEGSLLVIRSNEKKLIPLGRVFEVFGPVTRPLYTIRLPTTLATPKEEEKEDNKPSSSDESSEKPEQKEDTPNPVCLDDPWGDKGEYTNLTRATENLSVYFVVDEAKLIDTNAIMKSSGKGCDASNLYDEEVMNSNDMYYSDDEKEREAKGGRKGRKSGSRRAGPNNSNNSREGEVRRQHHQAPPPQLQGFHSAPGTGTAYSNQTLPGGFQQAPPPSENCNSLPRGFNLHGAPPPPPPPPPRRPGAPGPPPPPSAGSSSMPPPAYDYSR